MYLKPLEFAKADETKALLMDRFEHPQLKLNIATLCPIG